MRLESFLPVPAKSVSSSSSSSFSMGANSCWASSSARRSIISWARFVKGLNISRHHQPRRQGICSALSALIFACSVKYSFSRILESSLTSKLYLRISMAQALYFCASGKVSSSSTCLNKSEYRLLSFSISVSSKYKSLSAFKSWLPANKISLSRLKSSEVAEL